MKPELKTVKICLNNDKEITIETGLLAKQAHGSCVVKMGDTMILATVVSDKNQKEGIDFLPLSVDYREKFAADGRFPGGFLKREGRPSDQEILGMRLVDRVLRPLFPGYLFVNLDIEKENWSKINSNLSSANTTCFK